MSRRTWRSAAPVVFTLLAAGFADAQPLPCGDADSSSPALHSVNQEVLYFTVPPAGRVAVRVFGEDGKPVARDEYRVLSPNEVKPDGTFRLPLRDAPFYPEKRFITTTASSGCVRGTARRPPLSPCVAWFELPPASRPPVDILIDELGDVPDGTPVEVTLHVDFLSGGGRCTTKLMLEAGDTIKDVIDGQTVSIVVRRNPSVPSPPYVVDMKTLRRTGVDRTRPARVTDGVRAAQTRSGQGRAGSSLNQVAAAAPAATVTVRVAR